MPGDVRVVNDDTFETVVLSSELPVVVDFWAEWCGPCRAFAPVFEELSSQYAGKILFVKMNVDESQHTAARFGVRGIPTIILFKGGVCAETRVGAMSKSQMVAFLDSH